MSQAHVVVLMGGRSLEHEVSMAGGTKVAANIDRARFRVTSVVIGKDGRWAFPGREPMPLAQAAAALVDLAPDCVFPVLHGPFGEDGRLQGLLDLLELPYVGSGCIASGIAIDKPRAKDLVAYHGVRVPRHTILRRDTWRADSDDALARIDAEIGYPCVAKSPCQGSSLGMAIPASPSHLRDALPQLFELDAIVMVEEFVSGKEVTCSVVEVEPGAPQALPVTLIRPVSSSYFDYKAKYTPGACEEITPAPIASDTAARVQEIALDVHAHLGCRGLSRSDMILADSGPIWIEVNTLPGMTETSLVPQAAAAVGIPYPELCTRLVEAALGG